MSSQVISWSADDIIGIIYIHCDNLQCKTLLNIDVRQDVIFTDLQMGVLLNISNLPNLVKLIYCSAVVALPSR